MAATPRIGTMIKRARERQLMSQEELAVKLRVSRSAVNSWERDRAYPRNRIGALEEVLGIKLTADDGGQPPLELADLRPPRDDWEDQVFRALALPVDIKRRFIEDWRASQAAYAARQPGRHAAPATGKAPEEARPGG